MVMDTNIYKHIIHKENILIKPLYNKSIHFSQDYGSYKTNETEDLALEKHCIRCFDKERLVLTCFVNQKHVSHKRNLV